MIEYPEAKSEVTKYFEFLKTEYGYSGPFEWQCAYDKEYTYVKGNHYLNIAFDGAFFLSVGETKKVIPELATGKLKLGDINHNERKSFDLMYLLSQEEKTAHHNINNSDEELMFWANIIKNNSEILIGNWNKFSIKYKITKYIKTIISK